MKPKVNMQLRLASNYSETLFLYKCRTNPEIDKTLSGSPPPTYMAHIDFIEKHQGKTRYIYVAYVKGNMVGYSQIYDIVESSVEVGFVIQPKYQGKGLGQVLVKETVEQAHKDWPGRKIVLYVLDHNTTGVHIYKKCGFEEVDKKGNEIKMEYVND